jgi:hypothetical protein
MHLHAAHSCVEVFQQRLPLRVRRTIATVILETMPKNVAKNLNFLKSPAVCNRSLDSIVVIHNKIIYEMQKKRKKNPAIVN